MGIVGLSVGEDMARRMMGLLRVLAKEIIEKGYEADDTLKKLNAIDVDFITIKEELRDLEMSKHIDDSELDTIKALLVYMLMRDSDLDVEDIYAFIFGRGRQLTWN
jgi:hypothetical protein